MWLLVHAPHDARLSALRRVLLAAAGSGHCHSRLAAARLATPEQILSVRSIEEALERLAPDDGCALPPVLRRPPRRTLAGCFQDLLRPRPLPRDARRVAVWRSVAEDPLGDADRERLWDRFELPVFEELRSPEGELLAWECDAHEGLHIEESVAIAECLRGELVVTSLADVHWPVLRVRTGRSGELLRSPCGCGEAALHLEVAGERLTPLQPLHRSRRGAPGAALAAGGRAPARL